MRCECCDRILSDFEATSKFKESNTYTNMCKACAKSLPSEIEIVGNSDLEEELFEEDVKQEDDDGYEED